MPLPKMSPNEFSAAESFLKKRRNTVLDPKLFSIFCRHHEMPFKDAYELIGQACLIAGLQLPENEDAEEDSKE